MTTNSASGIGSSSLTTLGTIVTGVWNGTPMTVPYGGTGDSSFTAYSVLCGGTTSTGILQNVSTVGLSGQLTSNGSSALPTWQTSNAGSFQLIQSITASNQAAVIFNSQFTSTFDVYLFTFTNIQPSSSTAYLLSQVGTGSTPTWTTANYNWINVLIANSSEYGLSNSSDSSFPLSGNASPNLISNSSAGYNGFLYIYGTNGTSNVILGSGQGIYVQQSSYAALNQISFYNAAATYTSIQFYFSSGNVNSGTIRMFGMVK